MHDHLPIYCSRSFEICICDRLCNLCHMRQWHNNRWGIYQSCSERQSVLVHKQDSTDLDCREEVRFSAVTHPVVRDPAIATWRGIPLWGHHASWLLKSWNKRGQLALPCFRPCILSSLLPLPQLPFALLWFCPLPLYLTVLVLSSLWCCLMTVWLFFSIFLLAVCSAILRPFQLCSGFPLCCGCERDLFCPVLSALHRCTHLQHTAVHRTCSASQNQLRQLMLHLTLCSAPCKQRKQGKELHLTQRSAPCFVLRCLQGTERSVRCSITNAAGVEKQPSCVDRLIVSHVKSAEVGNSLYCINQSCSSGFILHLCFCVAMPSSCCAPCASSRFYPLGICTLLLVSSVPTCAHSLLCFLVFVPSSFPSSFLALSCHLCLLIMLPFCALPVCCCLAALPRLLHDGLQL